MREENTAMAVMTIAICDEIRKDAQKLYRHCLLYTSIFFCNMCYEAEIVFDKDIFCFRIAPLEL